ncbi:MAG: hypothetical protein R3264_16915 [Anaerolineae bacterium]|nr:hypothetical protein [Anaerolineae bacterium]
MKKEILSREPGLLIRRLILEPGEAMPWHIDLCRRYSVTIRGDKLGIEDRATGEIESFPVYPGLTGWDEPYLTVHRGVNVGTVPYEEVVIFFLDEPGMDPQPEQR